MEMFLLSPGLLPSLGYSQGSLSSLPGDLIFTSPPFALFFTSPGRRRAAPWTRVNVFDLKLALDISSPQSGNRLVSLDHCALDRKWLTFVLKDV